MPDQMNSRQARLIVVDDDPDIRYLIVQQVQQ